MKTEDLDLKSTKQNLYILTDVLNFIEEQDLDPEQDEVQELVDNIILDGLDFCIELDGKEYRFIYEHAIDTIYEEEQRDFIEQELPNLPSYVAIDWKQTIENLKADGFGHWFASYDGEELEAEFDGMFFYVFRVN